VRALYEKFACMIKEGNYTSQLIEMKTGVTQGWPRSGDLFCFFMSDLSPALAEAGAGLVVYEYFFFFFFFFVKKSLSYFSFVFVTRFFHNIFLLPFKDIFPLSPIFLPLLSFLH